MEKEKKSILVKCPSCRGTGQAQLSKALALTLAKFSGQKKRTATELSDGTQTPNAINNRLEQLRKLNLLDRERDGRFWRYFRAEGHVSGVLDVPLKEPEPKKVEPKAEAKPAKVKTAKPKKATWPKSKFPAGPKPKGEGKPWGAALKKR